MRRLRLRSNTVCVMVLACGLLAVASGGLIVWRLSFAVQHTAQQAKDQLHTALSDAQPGAIVEPGRVTSACAAASAAADAFVELNDQLGVLMPLVGSVENLPWVGTKARSHAAALEVGTQLSSVAASLCDSSGALEAFLSSGGPGDAPISTSESILTLVNAEPRYLDAIQRLERLQTLLADTPDGGLDPADLSALATVRERLPRLIATLRDTCVLLDMVGAQQPRRYLLVSQNPDELRATGGFIGSAGVLEATRGSLRLIEYGTSRRYDTPADLRAIPPAEFRQYLGDNSWNLAAANWWASYPDVARQLAYFYSLSTPQAPVDGVIAVDQFGLQRILEVLGPVEVPEFAEHVSATDLQAKLDRYVHAGDWTDEPGRKRFTAALATAMLSELQSAPRREFGDLVRALRSALDEQHLLIWTSEPRAAELVAARGWDDSILPTSGDSLFVIDTELGASKQSQAVSRDAAYSVVLDDTDSPRATLEVTYTNQAQPEQRPEVQYVDTYRTFVRALVPGGSRLLAASGFDGEISIDEECGRRVFGGQVTVPGHGGATAKLEYQLPRDLVSRSSYDLVVQQQPGVPMGATTVIVSASRQATPTAHARLQNVPGQHAHWRLDSADASRLLARPLPVARPDGCGLPLAEAQPVAPPVSISLPSLHDEARIVELGIDADGVMQPPPAPDVVGWYRMSARPGQPGNSVLSGHLDWNGKMAVFGGLRKMHAGDLIQVRDGVGLLHSYRVEWNKTFKAASAPVDDLVGPSAESVLTLITCDGSFDHRTRQYNERRIVRAHLTDEATQ